MAEHSELPSSLIWIEEFHSKFTSPSYAAAPFGRDPWDIFKAMKPSENIILKGSSEEIQGLVSINGQKNRRVEYEGLLDPSGVNSMNIDVRGITVTAINTIEGGKAVATSEVILKPVQYLSGPGDAELREKLS